MDFLNRAIKYCDEHINRSMTDSEFELALKMCHKLYDEEVLNKYKNSEEILTAISYRQYNFQEKGFNNFTRYYYIFADLWNRLEYLNNIDILSEIESEIGLPYQCAVIFAYAVAGNKSGFLRLYDKEIIKQLNKHTGILITIKSHENFLKWCSGDFSEIIKGKTILPSFAVHPIINTKLRPIENMSEVYLIASPQFLFDKISTGLYFTLSNRFRMKGKRNKFKEVFGFVFQEYVGELLRYNFDKWDVVPEVRYLKSKRRQQDTVDWFVIKNNKLIMIEVKQLEVSERDICDKFYPELERFNGVTSFVKLIVVNDPIYNANFVVKSLMKDEVSGLDFHVININDFELLLSNQKNDESLFELLNVKSLKYNEMDFREYNLSMFPNSNCKVEFLESAWEKCFSGMSMT